RRDPALEPADLAPADDVQAGAVPRPGPRECDRSDPDRRRELGAPLARGAGNLALAARAVVVLPDVAADPREPGTARVDDHLAAPAACARVGVEEPVLRADRNVPVES